MLYLNTNEMAGDNVDNLMEDEALIKQQEELML
jgi:hypothetical protein